MLQNSELGYSLGEKKFSIEWKPKKKIYSDNKENFEVFHDSRGHFIKYKHLISEEYKMW